MVENNHHIMSGDLKSTRLFGKLIAQRLGSKQVKPTNEDSSKKVSCYLVNIMGNTASRKQVMLKIIEDSRNDTGEIKVEHGAEFLQWQSNISRLCDCCANNISKSHGMFYVCVRAAEPNTVRDTGLCSWYKFSEQRYKEYVNKR